MNTRATAVVVNDGKILMIQRRNNGEDYWVLPGGKVDEGETVEQAVLRELNEETTIHGECGKQILEFLDELDERGFRHVLFAIKYISGEPALHADSEEFKKQSEEQSYIPQWVEINKLPGLTIYPQKEKEFLIQYLK